MQRRNNILFSLLATSVVLLFACDLVVGTVRISLSDVAGALFGSDTNIALQSIVFDIRLTKAIMAIVAGIALSISGLQMQTLFRNPMAGPYVLGVSAGASFGVALFLLGAPLVGIAASGTLGTLGTAGAAWIGAATVLLVVVALARRIKDIMVILILGMMLSSALGAIVEILQYLSNEQSLKSFVIWTMGSLGDVTRAQLAIIAPLVTLGIALSVATIKPLNTLLLGETYARTSGINLTRTRRTILASTTLLAGTITAFCGPVGFVGLAVPHIARMVFRSADHRILLPASALIGGGMMLVGDIISKWLLLPINTITALMGIPIVVYIVLRNRNLMQ